MEQAKNSLLDLDEMDDKDLDRIRGESAVLAQKDREIRARE